MRPAGYIKDMNTLLAIALGLEVSQFAPTNDSADSLSGSLDALQSGAWTLSPYLGPAIQPYLSVQRGHLSLGLAPSGSWRRAPATTADGREGILHVSQWRVQARIRWHQGRGQFGLDGGLSNGQAQIDGDSVGQGTRVIHISPTAGISLDLAEDLSAIGRVMWPFEVYNDSSVHGPAAALAVEWRP
jgi:hypothetical protein